MSESILDDLQKHLKDKLQKHGIVGSVRIIDNHENPEYNKRNYVELKATKDQRPANALMLEISTIQDRKAVADAFSSDAIHKLSD
jgi:hypothetical protein